jgi:predicted  nucleic acid-binding Zn-ribbon protein
LNPFLKPLIDLQSLDLRIVEIKEQQRRIPEQKAAAEASLKESRRRLQEIMVSTEGLTKERRSVERDLESHEAQIQKLRARLSELKTNKEYQAHLFEIEMANKKKSEIEDQILSYMERIERAQQDTKQIQVTIAEAERAFNHEQTRLQSLGDRLSAELADLEDSRQQVARLLDKDLLDRYNRLKSKLKALALAPIRNGICFGCRLQIPPQLVAEVKRSDVLQSCSYCQRILYWEGEPNQLTPMESESAQVKGGT